MRRKTWFVAGLVAGLVGWAGPRPAAAQPVRVALTGTAAPAGGNYTGFTSDPVLNASGQVGYIASLTSGTATSGVFVGAAGAVQSVALQGGSAPGGGTYTSFTPLPSLNATGQVAFTASLSGSSRGIFTGTSTPGSVVAVARQGGAAPSGGSYGTNFFPPVLNGSGQVAFSPSLSGGSSCTFAGLPGSLQVVAVQGTSAPAGGNYAFTGVSALNSFGRVAIVATLTGGSSSGGLFVGSPMAL